MLALGSLAFTAPWALAALALLPALWWLLRITPPAPQRLRFPPIRLLLDLERREETSAHTPWWLLLLRLLLAATLILGAARPLLHPQAAVGGQGPLFLIVDDGWAAAPQWTAVRETLTDLLNIAQRQQRSVVLVTTAPTASQLVPTLAPAASVREAAQLLEPKPWPTDRLAAVRALVAANRTANWPPGSVVWLADGLAEDGSRPASPEQGQGQAQAQGQAAELVALLRPLGPVSAYLPPAGSQALLLKRSDDSSHPLAVTIVRPVQAAALAASPTLRFIAEDGSVIARERLTLAEGMTTATSQPQLPAEWLQRLARVQIEGNASAGAVLLADAGWQRRPVGLLSETPASGERPLIGAFYYVERALEPFAEIRRGTVIDLLHRDLSMLVMADVGSLDPASAAAVRAWVESGGVLLRFGGPSLLQAAKSADPLLPVRLRAADRVIGGALSWGTPGRLAPFEATSPFAGLSIPDDVEIRRQVLAEPELDVAGRTWARLEDGTPLISAARLGAGWVVLVQTTANADWSSLPLSGLFVEMLHRILDLGRGAAAVTADAPPMRPIETLDGFGRLGRPPAGTTAIAASAFAHIDLGPQHPPGYYGSEDARAALNLSSRVTMLTPLGDLPSTVSLARYGATVERDLRPWLWGLALLLALVDLGLSLGQRGLLPRRRRAGAAVILVGLCLAGLAATPALAAPAAGRTGSERSSADSGDGEVVADGTAIAAALASRLAFVRTGDAAVDAISEAGLTGLTTVINRRTAAALAAPVGVDPGQDELAFYPLLYWPLTGAAPSLSPAGARHVTAFMRTGGTILFDTRGSGGDWNTLARQLDLPPLVPVDDDHVLKRSYYLLADLPGRWSGRPVWVEPSADTINDGVSTVVAGSQDWAGAWAVDASRRPLLPVAPGGERQREMAYRFGVNLVMYVLTGNYKADQVHLPTILERLDQ